MARSPAINGLIVVVVVALVGGVAWFKSQRETETPAVESRVVASERAKTPPPQPSAPTPWSGAARTEVRGSSSDSAEAGAPANPLAKEDAVAVDDATAVAARDLARPSPDDSPRPVEPLRENEPLAAAQPETDTTTAPATSAPDDAPASQPSAAKMPRVIDLGADKCKACKELAPILVELKKEYAGRAVVEFVDVWKNPKAADPYKIRVIPTQIFFDRDGKEVWRHEGFLPKKEFVAKLAELGAK